MPRILGFLVAAWVVGLALPAQAQQAVLSQLYGQGVHEFFGGHYQAAKQSLSEAAANDSRDPRVYYYRALANLRLGNEAAAKSDFDTGAALEYTPAGRQFAVSRSLQRIQGRERQTLEKHRAQAKMTAFRAAEQRRQARYGRERQEDFDDLREQAVAPATAIDRMPRPTSTDDVAEEPLQPATVVDPADFGQPAAEPPPTAATEPPAEAGPPAEEGTVPAPVFGNIIGRALSNALGPDAAAPATPAPTAAEGDPFEDPGVAEPALDAPEPAEDFAPPEDLLSPDPVIPAPAADESDPFSMPDETAPAPSAPADESDPLADPLAPDAGPLEDPATTPDAADSLDDATAPLEEPAEAPLEEPADVAPLAEEPAADSPPMEEPAADAPLEDPAEAPLEEPADSLDEPPDEPAADSLDEMPDPAPDAPADADAPVEPELAPE